MPFIQKSSEELLRLAAPKGGIKAVKALLAKGIDVNAKNTRDYTALMLASWMGHTAIVQLLKQAGAEE